MNTRINQTEAALMMPMPANAQAERIQALRQQALQQSDSGIGRWFRSLTLRLFLLFLVGMMADRAADGGAHDTVLAGDVTDDATRKRAYDAAGVRRASRQHQASANRSQFRFHLHDCSL